MALVLAQKTQLPIWGLFDEVGLCHHAFVFDEGLNLGIDARGILSIEKLKIGCKGQTPKPLELVDLKDYLDRSHFPDSEILHTGEIREARKYIKTVLELQDGTLNEQLFSLRESEEFSPKL
jgi:hypothetical protein